MHMLHNLFSLQQLAFLSVITMQQNLDIYRKEYPEPNSRQNIQSPNSSIESLTPFKTHAL